MEAIILAGGSGSRLRPVIFDLPKPMAPVQGKPFLDWLLDDLHRKGIRRVVISTGYLAEKIQMHFGETFQSMELVYSRESEPLGTGGALRLAMKKVAGSACLVLNGDSFFSVDLRAMEALHRTREADLTIALKPGKEFDRYGTVLLDGDRVSEFREKQSQSENHGAGWINAGIYLCRKALFDSLELPAEFSFEHDFLAVFCRQMKFHGFISDGFFIDIGVPEEYARAQTDPHFRLLAP